MKSLLFIVDEKTSPQTLKTKNTITIKFSAKLLPTGIYYYEKIYPKEDEQRN